MKYFVTVGDRELTVEVDGDSVSVDGKQVDASLARIPSTPEVRVVIDGMATTVVVESQQGAAWRLVEGGAVREVSVEDERARHIRLLAGSGRAVDPHVVVKAPMPGLVVRVLVAVGDRLAAGAPLLALEAMKMENEIKAAAAGTVRAIGVKPGDVVEKGKVLVEIQTGSD
jgi:pyruvate carboxylase subunit B